MKSAHGDFQERFLEMDSDVKLDVHDRRYSLDSGTTILEVDLFRALPTRKIEVPLTTLLLPKFETLHLEK